MNMVCNNIVYSLEIDLIFNNLAMHLNAQGLTYLSGKFYLVVGGLKFGIVHVY